jgi:AraC-like DNA-binding protein
MFGRVLKGRICMDYIPRIPAPPLNAYIDDLYYINGISPYPRLKALPMPSLHLMINLGQPFQVYSPAQSQPFATCNESWWIGLWNTCFIVDWPGTVQCYGVHFKPAGIYPFLQSPLSELRNQVIPLDAVWGWDASEIRERLCAAPTVHDGLALLERMLLARLAEDLHGLDVVQYAIGQIDRQYGLVSIRGLSDHIGISENHLGTQFKRIVGVTPKDLARFYRFAHVVTSIDPSQLVDWEHLANRAGFYDLSHLNKDFVAFTGHNPTDYLRLRRRLQSEHPEHALGIGSLPTD